MKVEAICKLIVNDLSGSTVASPWPGAEFGMN